MSLHLPFSLCLSVCLSVYLSNSFFFFLHGQFDKTDTPTNFAFVSSCLQHPSACFETVPILSLPLQVSVCLFTRSRGRRKREKTKERGRGRDCLPQSSRASRSKTTPREMPRASSFSFFLSLEEPTYPTHQVYVHQRKEDSESRETERPDGNLP